MTSEIKNTSASSVRTCQNCKNEFIIEPDDFAFYEKIQVPPPTFCSHCRYQRRLSWRNTWHLFKKTDARTGEKIFSLFPEESPIKIYEKEYWNGDGWDPMDYGRVYDFKRPFFEQFRDLFHTVPLPAHSVTNLVNCEYCTNANDLKGCYLVRASTRSEDSIYLIWDHESKHCLDSHMTNRCELSYGNLNTMRCYKTFFSVDCEDCQSVILSKDCVGCSDCFGCFGLRNKSYYIWNEPHTKESYAEVLASFDIGSAKSLDALTRRAYAHWKKYPHKFMHGRQNLGVSGDYISMSKNAKQCFRVRGTEDSKFCQNFLDGPSKDCYDYSNWGENVELVYETLIAGMGVYNVRFCWNNFPNVKNLEYCIFCPGSSDCFGCIGLKKKQYCIFNTQYSKDEFEKLRERIIAQMHEIPYVDKKGRIYTYGEFFPSELSPFPYESTEAYEFFPLDEHEAKDKGFVWYPTTRQTYPITLKSDSIPDHIKEVSDKVVQEVLECAHRGECKEECIGAFRVVSEEVAFCKQMNIALPRLCPNCRHYSRLALRNSPRFFVRKCQCAGIASENGIYKNFVSHSHGDGHCQIEFETSYGPERKEIIYCEQCYQAEVA
ncbi:MAG: hypothetical protein NUV53_01415 [Patescibacteria group bacterium]|nr:hypothetical protein [Patescibacteria group bacterium]